MDLGGRSSGSVSRPRRTSADGNQRAIVANSVSNVPAGCGAGAIGPRLAAAHADLEGARSGRRVRPVIGVNIGKTKIVAASDAVADYVASTRELAALALIGAGVRVEEATRFLIRLGDEAAHVMPFMRWPFGTW